MISRVAEHCFWLSRYLERSENTARLLDVNRSLLLDFEVPEDQQWLPLLKISGIHEYAGESDAEAVQRFMTWDDANPCSIVRSLASARENARVVREVISAEMWERLNFYHLWLQSQASRALYERDRSEFYAEIRRITPLIHGITDATMSHGDPWEFMQLGKYLERACQTARILDVKYHVLLPSPDLVGTPVDNARWVAVLMSCSGYEPFQKQRLNVERGIPTSVADFLIFDPLFPRSVLRCLRDCRQRLDVVGRAEQRTARNADLALDELLAKLDGQSAETLMRDGLHESLIDVVGRIHAVGDAMHRTFFDVESQLPPEPKHNPERNGKPQ